MMEQNLQKKDERNELGLNMIGDEGERKDAGGSPLKIEANGLFGDDNFD